MKKVLVKEPVPVSECVPDRSCGGRTSPRSRVVRGAWFRCARGLAWGLLLVLALPSESDAQAPTDPVTARALFHEGRSLAALELYERACLAFEESQRLDPGIGTLFNWADCLEHLGKTASAWVRYLDVASAARTAGQLDREKASRARALALEGKLSRLTVQVEVSEPGLVVFRDGVALGSILWGKSVPVDPGSHTLTARAPGKREWKSTLEVKADGAHQTVLIPPLEADSGASVVIPTPVPSAGFPLTPEEPPAALGRGGSAIPRSPVSTAAVSPADPYGPVRGWRRVQRPMAYVSGGIGLAALVAGAFALVESNSKNARARDICVDIPLDCPREQITEHGQLVSEVRQGRTEATVAFIFGGVALSGGVVLLATAPATGPRHSGSAGETPRLARAKRFPASWHLHALIREHTTGVWVGGEW